MPQSVRDFLFYFVAQMLSYGWVAWNNRAIAFVWYGNIIASDLVIGAQNWIMIKRIAQAKSRAGMVGYVLGGPVGTLISVWLTKHFLG